MSAARLAFRKYPTWFVPVLMATTVLTAGQLGHLLAAEGMEYAHRSGWKPVQQHALTDLQVAGSEFAVSPIGDRYLVYAKHGASGRVELYTTTGKLLWSKIDLVEKPCFSLDGTQLFSGADAWDTQTGRSLAHAPAKNYAGNITWTASGDSALWRDSKGLHLWNRATGKTRFFSYESKLHFGKGSELILSPDGRWLAAIVDKAGAVGSVLFWDITRFDKPDLYESRGYMGETDSIAFSPDSKAMLLMGKESIYRTHAWVNVRFLDDRESYTFYPEQDVQQMAWSPDNKRFVLCGRKKWSVYEAYSSKLLWSAYHSTGEFVSGPYLTRDNKLYYSERSGGQQTLKYWNLAQTLAEK